VSNVTAKGQWFNIEAELVGGFNSSDKYESVGLMKFLIYGKIIHSCSKPPTRDFRTRGFPNKTN
jgi:hypothetical protein